MAIKNAPSAFLLAREKMSMADTPKPCSNPITSDHPTGQAGETRHWSPSTRIAFRFMFVYAALYAAPSVLENTPIVGIVVLPYQAFWHVAVPWVGRHLLGLSITKVTTGSGDTAFAYVQVLCLLAIAVAATAVWTLLDRGRPNYARLDDVLRVLVRYSLALTMITYGAVKVIPVQMPPPSFGRLVQPFGDASPMGLLWTFIGASPAYEAFAGAGELLGGLLLVFRRTTLLGALVSIGVLAHVVTLNFCYDVPVKLMSSHLLAMAAFLTLPDLRRLADLFLFNRAVGPAAIGSLFGRPSLDRAGRIFRAAFIPLFTLSQFAMAYAMFQSYSDAYPKPPLYGIWDVEEFEADGLARPPLSTDALRWRRFIVENGDMASVQTMPETRPRFYALTLDRAKNTLTLSQGNDPKGGCELAYSEHTPNTLSLEGTFGGQKVRARLRRFDESTFLLRSRGFHWVSEFPFNR
jgi:hypothetical protein